MPKAILRNGAILPLEPLPPEWTEGQELCVESASELSEDADFDKWLTDLQAMVAQNDPADLARVDKTLRDADEQAKAIVRKEMGLP
jgi:hypothetical protein